MSPSEKISAEMPNESIIGQKVTLRPLTLNDVTDRYVSWLNDTEVNAYLETGKEAVSLEDVREFVQKNAGSSSSHMFAIILKSDDRHVGNIRLGGINWIHRYANLGILIGEKSCWGKGYGTEACQLLLRYAFGRLNLNKVTLGVYANHTGAIKAYERVGFKIEGCLEKMFVYEGEYVDKTIMGILKEDYKNVQSKFNMKNTHKQNHKMSIKK